MDAGNVSVIAAAREPTPAETRVAKALVVQHGFVWPDENGRPSHPTRGADVPYWIDMAKAAIRAMYEPDETMLTAYMGALEQPANPHKEPWHKAKMRRRWRAMIDAASPAEGTAP